MAKLNTVPLEAFAACLQKLFKDSTNVFKLVEITLNRNKTIFCFQVFFYVFFHQSWNYIARPCIKTYQQ
jgi:hypothetical protein